VPHFQLITVDGDVLGARELDGPDWPAGSVIFTGSTEPNLRRPRARHRERRPGHVQMAAVGLAGYLADEKILSVRRLY
jgi:hypothetical protein